MHDDLQNLIRETATAVRRRDFLWVVGVSGGVCAALVLFADVAGWMAAAIWIASVGGLAVRYFAAGSRVWARPVQRIVEAELGAREAELTTLRLVRSMVASLPDPVLLVDETGRVDLANHASEEFFGVRAEGRHLSAFLRAPAVLAAFEEIGEGAPAHSVDFVLSGGAERACRAFAAPLADGSRTRVLLVLRDLTAEKRLERMRADFVASASHELRTPLAAMLGFIETLRGHAKDDPAARERFLGIMQDQAERMGRLVSDLMSLSRIELDENVPPRDETDLRAAAIDAVAGLAPIAEQRGVELVTLGRGTPLPVVGDRDQLIQVVQNLVDNALRYGASGGRIEIAVGSGPAPGVAPAGDAHRYGDMVDQIATRRGRKVEDVAYVQVRDYGPGIERSALPRLTERFYRVNAEESRARGGTGLGLAIVKHIANRHRGGLMVETAADRGSAFTLYLPVAESGPALAEAAQ